MKISFVFASVAHLIFNSISSGFSYKFSIRIDSFASKIISSFDKQYFDLIGVEFLIFCKNLPPVSRIEL